MKNYNLIERLGKTDSHEKQSPQRFTRYAAMLIMLLTLGVGQMWAGAGLYEVYFEYSYNGNNSSATYTSSTSSTQTIALGTLTADFKIKSMYPKVWKDGSGNICGCLVEYYIDSDKEKTGFSYDKSLGGNNHQWKNTTSWTVASYNSGASGSYTFWYRFKAWGSSSSSSNCGDNTYYIPTGGVKNKFTYNIAPPAISSFSVAETGYLSGSGTSEDPYIIPYNGTLTLTVSGSKGRTDANSTIKYWKNSGSKQNSNVLTVTGITSTTKASVVVHAQCINNDDSSLTGAESTKTVYYKSEAAYNVTAASGGHGSVTPTSATMMGTTSGGNIMATPNTGYDFTSWAITSGGGYFGSTGTATTSTTANTKFRPSASTTVTATFTAKTTTVTLNANAPGGQTVTGGGTTVTATYDATLPSFSALSCTGGYALKGYYDNTSGGNKIINADGSFNSNSGTWNRLDGASLALYAQWSLDRTLTYDGNTNTGGSVPADPAVYSNGASVTVLGNTNSLVKNGYTFTGWNTAANGSGASYSAGDNITMNGNYTLFAQWTENITAVTISASPAGTGTFTVGGVSGTSASVGVTTTAAIVATPATDFQFTSWATTNCSVSPTNNATTTLTGDGSSATGTLTATFTENVASGWYLGGTDFGNSWATSNTAYPLNKKYRGMEGVFYCQGTVTTAAYDCLHNGATRYRPTSNTTFNGAGWSNKISLSSTTADANYRFKTAGTYYIIADTRGATPVIWYETSEPTRFNYHSVNVTGVENAKGTCKVTLGSTSGFETSRFANGETFYVTITGVSGYIPTITIGGTPTTWWKEQATYTASGTMSTSDVAVTISYTPTRAVTFAMTTGCNSLSATGPSSTAVTTGTKVKDGTVIRFAQTNSTGYTFSKWYSNTTGTSGTQYSASSSAYDLTISSSAYTIYPLYTENMTTVNLVASPTGKGTFTSGEAVSSVSAGVATKPTVTAVPGTGYHLAGTIWSESSDYISLSSATNAATTITATGTTGNTADLTATFTPNTYTVHFHRNGGAGDVVEQNFTYDVAQNLTANTYTKTGYNFAGWATAADGSVVYADEANVSNLTSTNNGTFHLYAKWTPKTATITYSQSGTGYSTGGQSTTKTATYDAAMPTTISTPTAANGWAFLGYYDALEPLGTQYYNADGTSARTWDKEDASVTLYAYFKKAEITDVELNETMFDPVAAGDEGYVVANPTIAPNPTGDHIICWELLYDNNNPVTGHDAIADPDGSHLNRIKFSIAGLAAGGYKIRTTLRTGSSCAGGTLLDTRVTKFQIANAFTVTVEYKDSEGNTIAASTTSPGKALESTDITAPDLIGYTFSTWQLGEGMSTEEALTIKTDFSYKTTFNSTLTAVYTKKRMIYFNNTLGWESVYVYFYKNDSYWETSGSKRGSGSKTTSTWTDTPYELGKHGQMQPVSEGSNIYYFDAEAEGVPSSYDDVVFTEDSQHNYEFFHKTNAVRRGDYKTSLPMFVPVPKTEQTADVHNETNYYNHGCWMNYPENTGYVLHIYNSKTYGASDELMSIPFEYTADKTMPMSLTVELAGGKEYGFEIHRADSKKYGTNTKVMKNGDSGDNGTGWALAENQRTGLLTSVAGDYTFTLNYGNSGGYNFLAGVHYPVAANDYRVVYNDRVAWSLGSAHDASWYHPSRAIEKKDGAEDIVSFYVSKEVGASASMKFQYASSVSGEGVVTWSDVDGGSISLSDITESGVYNFYLSQAAGSITVDSIRPYTGQYYIRSQAVTGGWDNYRVGSDHKMTYSEFSESAANTFGEKFSHYKAKWCPRNTNIAFTIANDYSMCITDTLKQDVGNPYGNTDADGKLNNDGNPSHDGSNAYLDPYSANVRFMWNRKTNKISRAYVASSTSTEARFLVLQGSGTANANIFGENGSDLSADPPGANATLLRDDQNWIYEITVQANPSALVKLYANYKGKTQYFRGTSDAGFVKGTSAVELLGGTSSSSKYSVRVVYDFKTNRLVTAWQPTGATQEIDGVLDINADVMVIRSHHEPAQCITFANDESALTGVKTVYGVMQFNRWILNNREHPEDDTPEHCADASAIASYHRPLAIGDQKSIYERSHYYISFPFDVKLSDVFGFGQYWNEWYIEWYDGLTRAKNGYWIDSPSNWKYVTPEEKDNFVLKANQGYILGLDMDYMQATDFSFWTNKNTTIELYFPSTVSLETLKSTEVRIPALNTIEGDPYRCTINRENGDDGDRRIKDSYWRCIGVPSFNIYNSTLKDEKGNTIEWKDNYEWQEDDAAFPFIYLWNKADNTITPQATSEFSFQPMHAYLVQNGGEIVWTAVSAKPSSIVARQRNTEPEEYNWRLELQQNNQMIDRTYIRMKDLESVTDGFDFGQDMSKEFNKKRSAIYSFIGTEKVAANSMTVHTDQTTIVPLGLDIKSAGEYVISLPEGTNGVGVVLVDSITGTRTNLGLMDYEVSLTAGKIDNRFLLEISPIVQTPTDVEEVSGDGLQVTGARKVIIDQKMYIIKDGQVFDARGSRVK